MNRLLKWMEGSTKMEGSYLGCYRESGETFLVIYGLDGYIHEIRASEIVPI